MPNGSSSEINCNTATFRPPHFAPDVPSTSDPLQGPDGRRESSTTDNKSNAVTRQGWSAVAAGQWVPRVRVYRKSQAMRWSNSCSGGGWAWEAKSPVRPSGRSYSGWPRAGAMRGGAVGSPRSRKGSRTAEGWVLNAIVHIAPTQLGHRTRIQPRGTKREPLHGKIERPLSRRRASALRRTDGLQRVGCRRRTGRAQQLLRRFHPTLIGQGRRT